MNSKESLSTVVQGSHTVFLVTTPDFMSGGSSQELNHGKNVTDVAKESGVQHLLFSSLLHVTEETKGRLKHVLHFDMKADVERYIRSKGIPSTFILPGYFMSNFTALQMLRKGEDGVFSLAYPVSEKAKFPLIDTESDIGMSSFPAHPYSMIRRYSVLHILTDWLLLGKYAVAVMRNRSEVLDKQILAAADYYTPTQIISEFEEVTGHRGRFVQLDAETYKGFLPEPMAEEMLENHLFIDDPGYFAGRSLQESLDLLAGIGLKPTTWKEFLAKNKSVFN